MLNTFKKIGRDAVVVGITYVIIAAYKYVVNLVRCICVNKDLEAVEKYRMQMKK